MKNGTCNMHREVINGYIIFVEKFEWQSLLGKLWFENVMKY